MAPKKILYVDYYSFVGGAQVNLLSVFAGLDRRRYLPILVLPGEGPFAAKARRLEVPVHIIPMGKARWRKPWEAAPAMWMIKKLIDREKIALVHANCYPANKLAGPAAALCGVPCIWHKQIAVTQKPGSSTGFLWRLYSNFNHMVLGVSRQVVEGLKALGIPEDKITLIYNNADTGALSRVKALPAAERRRHGLPDSAPLVGAAGMRRPHKGFDIYLRACAVVAGRDRKAHFLLVGDEAHAEAGHEAHLRNLQNDPRLKGRLHVLPSQPELAAWLKSLAVFVLSSRWEGSPLVLLEAMALGVPVVVTAEGAGEIVEDGKDGLLVDAGDAPGMAAGILRLLKDRALARRLGRAAKAKVSRHFSLRKYVRDLMGIYDEVLGPRGSAASASSPQRQDSTGL